MSIDKVPVQPCGRMGVGAMKSTSKRPINYSHYFEGDTTLRLVQ